MKLSSGSAQALKLTILCLFIMMFMQQHGVCFLRKWMQKMGPLKSWAKLPAWNL